MLDSAAAHLAGAYPAEACGWLLVGPGGWRVAPVANDLVRTDPNAARHGFVMAPSDLIRAVKDADRTGARLAAAFHSHPDGPARPSARDCSAWAPGGEPLYPEAVFLVGQLDRARADAVRWSAYGWRDGFVGVSIGAVGGG